jgi:cyclopropane fatty-acyl-phospholipid synthase-like methyltransferase
MLSSRSLSVFTLGISPDRPRIYLCAVMSRSILRALVLPAALCVALAGCRPAPGPADADHPTSAPAPEGDGFAAEAETYEAAERVIWQKPDLVIDQLGDVKGKVIADLGAGTGYFSRRLAYVGAKVIAIDIDPNAIRWMEEQRARFPPELQERLAIRQAMPDDPGLAPDEVDKVLLVNTYTYIQDRQAYFTRLREAIRPGGMILVIDFKKKDTPFGPDMEDRLDEKQVIDELQSAGYHVMAVDDTSLDYQYMITFRRD